MIKNIIILYLCKKGNSTQYSKPAVFDKIDFDIVQQYSKIHKQISIEN